MKRKFYLLSSFIGILFFLSFGISKAATVFQQPVSSEIEYYSDSIFYQSLGQATASSTIDSVIVNTVSTSTNNVITATLIQCLSLGSQFPNDCFSEGQLNGTVSVSLPFDGFVKIPFSNATSTVPGRYYLLGLSTQPGTTATAFRGSINENSYVDGYCDLTTQTGCDVLKDLYFVVGSNLNTTISGTYINLTFPHNNEVLNDFDYWYVNYNVSTTTQDDYPTIPKNEILINVRYATTTANLNNDAAYIDGFSLFQIGYASTTITKNNGVPVGDYYAQAFIGSRDLNSGSIYVIATSSIISISILTQNNFEPPTTIGDLGNFATSTGDVFNQCYQLGVNSWQTAVCNVFAFLFQPHDSSFETLKDVLFSFTKVFPFNIFFGLQYNNLSNFANAPDGKTFTYTVHQGPLNFSADLLTPTALQDTIGDPFTTIWFSLQRIFMYLALAFMIYRQIVTRYDK